MKISFFKNESHFHPRTSYTCENAEFISFNCEIQNLKKYAQWLFTLPSLIFIFAFLKNLVANPTLFLLIAIFCLPIHELCHALFCRLTGRKVEGIFFFPYKRLFSGPTAYVLPAFGVWNKAQVLLWCSFPLILLSLVPALLAVFFPSLKIWMIYLSLYNLSISCYDIVDILCVIRLPKNCLHFRDFFLTAKDANKHIIIHQLSVTPKLDKIEHNCYQYAHNKLTKINPPPESSEVLELKQEFIKQFNLDL